MDYSNLTREQLVEKLTAADIEKKQAVMFRQLLDQVPMAVARLDAQGNFIYVNDYFASLSGEAKERLLGSDVREWVGSEEKRILSELIGALTPDDTDFIYSLKLAQGNSIQWRSTGFFDAQGRLLYIDTFGMESEEGRDVYEMVRESKCKYADLFSNMPIGYICGSMIYDEERRPVDCLMREMNPAYETITGSGIPDSMGKSVSCSKVIQQRDFLRFFEEMINKREGIKFDYYSQSLERWFYIVLYATSNDNVIILFNDVSEQHRIYDIIQQNEKKFRIIFENLPVGVFLYDEDEKLINVNNRALEIFKFKYKSDIDGTLPFSSYEEDGHTVDLLKSGVVITFDFIYDTKAKLLLETYDPSNPDCKQLMGKLVALPAVNGKVGGYMLTVLDDTAAYQAYHLLREKDFIWSQAADFAGMFYWKYKLKTGTFQVSDEIYSFYGKQPGSVSKEDLLFTNGRCVGSRFTTPLMEKWEESMRRECDVMYEIGYDVSVDGRSLYNTSRWMKKEIDGEEYIFGITVDVTKMMSIQNALKENLTRLALVLEAGDVYPWFLNIKERRIEVGDEFFKARGLDRQVINEDFFTLDTFISSIYPSDREHFLRDFQAVVDGQMDKIRLEMRLDMIGSGVYSWVELNGAIQERDQDRKALKVLGFVTDIHERKMAEEELVIARKKAEESDKLKSSFLANVSHEIRTPLNAIVGFSEIIAAIEDEEQKKEYLDIIKANNNLLLHLINDILDLSKLESGMELVTENVCLEDICRELQQVHQLRVKDDLVILSEFPDGGLCLMTDRNRLCQVYSNLIGNAVKNTKKGSITIGYKLREKEIVCYVRDTGIGIPQDKLDTIFHRFVKVHENVQGFGLGLAISKTIVERMGGHMEVDSTLGVGSEFRFVVPYVPGDKEPARENSDRTSLPGHDAGESRRIKILIAEDNDYNYKFLYILLNKKYDLQRAANGKQAVALFTDYKPDLILMDMKMPEMGGLEATRIIRATLTDVPIIAVTAFAFDSDREEALLAGCNDFITKPVDKELLESVIKKYV